MLIGRGEAGRARGHAPAAARGASTMLIGRGGGTPGARPRPTASMPRLPAAARLAARRPGKETLPFRSDGIPGEPRRAAGRAAGQGGREQGWKSGRSCPGRCRRPKEPRRGSGRRYLGLERSRGSPRERGHRALGLGERRARECGPVHLRVLRGSRSEPAPEVPEDLCGVVQCPAKCERAVWVGMKGRSVPGSGRPWGPGWNVGS